ncbi:MAG TPA: hypothetical protein PK816_01300 [Candidatus Cloacimonadota bacterium]|nr:hypothetical protein [Candidatus Cloacimonadota bacterium]
MRLKFTKQFKLLIIALIILGAFGFAKLGPWFNSRGGQNPIAFQTEREFKKAKNFIKTKFEFNVEKFDEFGQKIDQISNNPNVNVIKKEQSSNAVIYLAEIKDSDYNAIVNEIRNYPSVGNKKEGSFKSTAFDKDIQQRLDVNIALKNKYMADLQKTKQAYTSDRLRIQLNTVQETIDSLQTQIKEQSHNKQNNLIFLVVSPKVSGSKHILASTTNFATRFIIGLVGVTLAVFVLLFVMNGILNLMSLLGFHTAKGSGGKSYSSYKYGSTGRYSYGGYGSNRKRKVKRIYKDPTTGEKTEVNSTEDKK